MAVGLFFAKSTLCHRHRWRGVLGSQMWVSADEGGDEICVFSVRVDSLRDLGVSLNAFIDEIQSEF